MFKNRKWLIICCLLLTLVGITVRQNIKPNPVISTTTTTKEFIWNEQTLNQAIEIIADEEGFEDIYLLKQLARIESQYLKHPEILDVNGWMSRGLFHFQTATFIEQASKFNLIPKDTTTEQGIILVQDVELQIRTICRMGNDDMRTVRNKWYNSWNKIYMCY